MSVQSVADLVRRCARERDASAWEEFVRRFGGRLRGGVQRALSRAGGGSPAEEFDDLLQEVYYKLLDDGARRLHRCRTVLGFDGGRPGADAAPVLAGAARGQGGGPRVLGRWRG